MTSSGVNRIDGHALSDFAHVEQSISVILTTPIGSRVMRRDFGSELFDLIDRPPTNQVILSVYAAAVIAIAKWEPRYAVTACQIERITETGQVVLNLGGLYYPRGHLGDFTRSEDMQTRVLFRR